MILVLSSIPSLSLSLVSTLFLFSLIFHVFKMHPDTLYLATPLCFFFILQVTHSKIRSYSAQIPALCMVYERPRENCQILKIKIHLLCIVTNSWHLFSPVYTPPPTSHMLCFVSVDAKPENIY
jgi:hypothetical protein